MEFALMTNKYEVIKMQNIRLSKRAPKVVVDEIIPSYNLKRKVIHV
ncbi:hypothetical protein [Neobacillus sp. DY30]|nr:hypothetical protein [Neobacillus sp. DY30]WHY01332.1 hypothetical protein QNH29_03515 [Neobacillus sp. DY30]